MRCVTLVPYRAGDFKRDRNWQIVLRHLRELGWPIMVGDSVGPWSRAQAINNAAAAAGDWDIALINDADTVGEPQRIRDAATIAYEMKGAIRPHDHLWMLRSDQTADFARQGPEGTIINWKTKLNPGGGLLVVSRSAWDTVGGYDPKFIEWGHEDSHLNTRLLAECFWDIIPGNAYHLYHHRDTRKTAQTWANKDRMKAIQAHYADVIERESKERGWDVGAYL